MWLEVTRGEGCIARRKRGPHQFPPLLNSLPLGLVPSWAEMHKAYCEPFLSTLPSSIPRSKSVSRLGLPKNSLSQSTLPPISPVDQENSFWFSQTNATSTLVFFLFFPPLDFIKLHALNVQHPTLKQGTAFYHWDKIPQEKNHLKWQNKQTEQLHLFWLVVSEVLVFELLGSISFGLVVRSVWWRKTVTWKSSRLRGREEEAKIPFKNLQYPYFLPLGPYYQNGNKHPCKAHPAQTENFCSALVVHIWGCIGFIWQITCAWPHRSGMHGFLSCSQLRKLRDACLTFYRFQAVNLWSSHGIFLWGMLKKQKFSRQEAMSL